MENGRFDFQCYPPPLYISRSYGPFFLHHYRHHHFPSSLLTSFFNILVMPQSCHQTAYQPGFENVLTILIKSIIGTAYQPMSMKNIHQTMVNRSKYHSKALSKSKKNAASFGFDERNINHKTTTTTSNIQFAA